MTWRAGQVYDLGPVSLQFLEMTFPTAGAPYPLEHKLGSSDVAVIVAGQDRAGDIYEGPIPRCRDGINLISSVAGMQAKFLLVASNLTER